MDVKSLTDSPVHERRRLLLGAGLIVLLVAAVYFRTAWYGYVWDDPVHVTENTMLRDLAGLWKIWTNPIDVFPQYYPLTLTSFWLEVQAFGVKPGPQHVINFLLHAANALLVWAVLRRLKVPGAYLAALIFAVHPINVESVAWVSERKNVLSGLFALSSAWFYAGWLEDGRRRGWYAALGLFLCAMLAKTVTATLPAAFLILHWLREGKVSRRDAANLAPFFGLGVALGLYSVFLEHSVAGADEVVWGFGLAGRVALAGRILWSYVIDLVWPASQVFIAPKWKVDGGSPVAWLWPLTAAALPVALWLARGKAGRGPLAAVAVYFVTILPVTGVVKVYPFKFAWTADHFAYLAAIPLFALLGAILAESARRVFPFPQRALAATLLVAALAGLSFARVPAYRDEETLWLDTLEKNPSATIATNNLGFAWFQQGNRWEDVVRVSQAGVDAGGYDAEVLVNLGGAQAVLGRVDEACANFRRALALDPTHPNATYNMYTCAIERGDLADAEKWLNRAIELMPDDPLPMLQLVYVALREGDKKKIRARLQDVLARFPDNAEAKTLMQSLMSEIHRPPDTLKWKAIRKEQNSK